MLTDKELKRFENKIQIDDETGCWNWTGAIDRKGYGYLKLRKLAQRLKTSKIDYFAHRVSKAHFHGEDVLSELETCHTCDNPACVNPNHIVFGTHADNMADMKRKGRANVGNKLTLKQVLDIKDRLDYTPASSLAKEFDVSHVTISHIKTGKTWTRGFGAG